MNGYPDWLINSIPLTQPFLESLTSVLSIDTVTDTTRKKFSKKQ